MAGSVASIVTGTALGVLEGRGLLVVVAGRLGVRDGSEVDFIVGVEDETTSASRFTLDGKPDPIKMNRIHAKSASMATLKKIPRADGRRP